jgi:hypothetical protein
LFGMLGLVALAELFVARHPLDFSEPTCLCWHATASAARWEASGRDVLFVGDSLVKLGLLPKVVEARSGLRGYNLANGRALPLTTYFWLRRALDAGARPSAVVVDFKPLFLTCPAEFDLRYWQETLTFREIIELAKLHRDRSLVTQLVLGRLLPTVRARMELRSNLMAAFRGEYDHSFLMNRIVQRHWPANDGAQVTVRKGTFTGKVGPGEEMEMQTMVVGQRPEHLRALDRFFALAAARGVRVYWLLPPLVPQLQASRERSGAEARYVALVNATCRRYPNVSVLDARHSGYDPSLFFDVTHLTRTGAVALSVDVADALRRDLSASDRPGTRWVTLPEYRPKSVKAPIEDFDASMDAVLHYGKRRAPRPAG